MHPTNLFGTRRFWPLFWTQFLGAFNDNFLKNALIVAILFQGVHVFGVPPQQMVALGGGIFILPFFLFSATAGQLAERIEKTRIIRWVKVTEILIMAIAGIGFVGLYFEFTLIALFLMGVHSTFFGPIKYSILPQHLRSEELVQGNAFVEAGTFLAILLGTIAGGSLINVPETGGIWVTAGLIVFAIAGLLTSIRIPLAPPTNPNLRVEWNVIPPTFRILRDLKKNRPVFESVRGISWFWFFGATMLSLLPPLCKDLIHSAPELVTFFLALFSIGIGVGSLLTERLSRGNLELGLIPLGSFGMTVFTLALGLSSVPVLEGGGIREFLATGEGRWVAFHLCMIAISSGFFTVPIYTMMQERSAPEQRSRTIAANNILNAAYMVVASLALMAAFAFGLSIGKIFVILALMNLGASLYSYVRLPEYLFRFLAFMLTHVMYRFQARGIASIPKTGPALLVCNHVSFVDWLIVSAAIHRPLRFVMDHNFEKGFLMRRFVKRSKTITIAPAKESVGKLRSAFVNIDTALREGDLVVVFPEGAITRDGKIGPFKSGVEKILAESPVPVIPMALGGLWGSLFSRKDGPALRKVPRRFRARVTLEIGAPIASEGIRAADLQRIVEELQRGADQNALQK